MYPAVYFPYGPIWADLAPKILPAPVIGQFPQTLEEFKRENTKTVVDCVISRNPYLLEKQVKQPYNYVYKGVSVLERALYTKDIEIIVIILRYIENSATENYVQPFTYCVYKHLNHISDLHRTDPEFEDSLLLSQAISRMNIEFFQCVFSGLYFQWKYTRTGPRPGTRPNTILKRILKGLNNQECWACYSKYITVDCPRQVPTDYEDMFEKILATESLPIQTALLYYYTGTSKLANIQRRYELYVPKMTMKLHRIRCSRFPCVE